jgi:hypothetical protein
MNARSVSILFLILIALIAAGCKKTTPPTILKEIGPAGIKAGEGFYVQPDGVSAMWVKTENATPKTVIMWGDQKIRTDFKEPQFLTAPVPKELYAKPGRYQIYLIDSETGAKSNSLTMIVE